jgi:hypothetical protein
MMTVPVLIACIVTLRADGPHRGKEACCEFKDGLLEKAGNPVLRHQ